MKYWMVRTGREGQRETYNLENDVITLGWSWLGDMSQVDTEGDLRRLQQQADPAFKKSTISAYATKLWQFFSKMEVGDVIIMPSKEKHSDIYVGRITSDYIYNYGSDRQYSHQRKVDWIDNFERKDLKKEASNIFNSPHSIFEIHHDPFLAYIREFLKSRVNVRDQLDTAKLEDRLAKWIGYGDIDADIWLLGMEEGGSTTFKEARVRVDLPPVSDIRQFHHRLRDEAGIETRWFSEDAILQSTYAPLIRILLCAQGQCGFDNPVSSKKNESKLTEKVREYQRDLFGRSDEGILITELLPLSNQSVSDWKYHRFTDREDLQSREQYEQVWKPKRIELFRELYSRKQPSLIIAYGKSNWDDYIQILGKNEETEKEVIVQGIAKRVGPMILIQHPVAFGVSNETWEEIGHYLRNHSDFDL